MFAWLILVWPTDTCW